MWNPFRKKRRDPQLDEIFEQFRGGMPERVWKLAAGGETVLIRDAKTGVIKDGDENDRRQTDDERTGDGAAG